MITDGIKQTCIANILLYFVGRWSSHQRCFETCEVLLDAILTPSPCACRPFATT